MADNPQIPGLPEGRMMLRAKPELSLLPAAILAAIGTALGEALGSDCGLISQSSHCLDFDSGRVTLPPQVEKG
jgi:hypothetical protein